MSSLMKSHITRRVEKIHLDSFNAFMPLFEAISNSIQAIEGKKQILDDIKWAVRYSDCSLSTILA